MLVLTFVAVGFKVGAVAVGAVVSFACGYAFRGKVHAAIAAADAKAKGAVSAVEKKL